MISLLPLLIVLCTYQVPAQAVYIPVKRDCNDTEGAITLAVCTYSHWHNTRVGHHHTYVRMYGVHTFY